MRVAVIAPGNGLPYYCENCTRDGSVLRALVERGHEVTCGTLYLPSPRDEYGRSAPVFYGALNLVLGQALPRGRGVPHWLHRALDHRPLLRFAASLSGTTDARGMVPLTLSVLRGEEGAQAGELDQLIQWLRSVCPDVLYLSNCLLLGIARRARRELGIPVACALQDEDTWIDAMGPKGQTAAWSILKERSAEVDLFLPVSSCYGGLMSARLGIGEGRMKVVHPGIDLEGFPGTPSTLDAEPPAVGFLARLSEAMGVDILVEAFALLCEGGGFPRLVLRLAGGGTPGDYRLISRLRRMLHRRGLGGRLEVVRSFGRRERIEFLRSIRVLSVPVRGGEAFGTFLLEAMACGVPVVQPDLGGFPEVIAPARAGVLYEPNTPEALADALAGVLSDSAAARAMGSAGFEAARSQFTSAHVAERLEDALTALARAGETCTT